jgi:hypothetical protein
MSPGGPPPPGRVAFGLVPATKIPAPPAELLHCDLRCDDPPRDGDAAAELAESRRGADDDTEPASADVPAAGGHVNAREFVAAQLPERLRSGYVGEHGDDGPHRGKPPRRDRLLCGRERVHDPESRRYGVSAISEFEARALGLPGERSTLAARATTGPETERAAPAGLGVRRRDCNAVYLNLMFPMRPLVRASATT